MNSIHIIIVWFLITCFIAQENIIGTSLPFLEVEMVSSQSGIISGINVKEGQRIEKNQVVAFLKSEFLKTSLKIAKAKANNKGELMAAKSQLALARSKLNKVMELVQKNHARPEEVEKTQAEVSLAEANVITIEEKGRISLLEVQQIEFQIEQHKVKSPFGGIVRKIIKQIGESISEVQPIMKLVQLDKIQIETFPSFEQARKCKIGDQVHVYFPQTKQKTQAYIIFIDPVVDFASNTVRIMATIDNRQGIFKSGLKCFLSLTSKKQ